MAKPVSVRTKMLSASGWRRKLRKPNFKSLRRAAAYLRGIARRMVKRRKKPAPPGKPPHTRKGQLKRAIFYAVDGRAQRAVIGPTFRGMGQSMMAHEHGGRFKGADFPERPLMNPALKTARDKLPRFWKGSIR